MTKNALSRRTVLRGSLGAAAISVALPRLESMLNINGDAFADGAALPTFYGTWFWGNSIIQSEFFPPTPGPNWTPSALLAPLGAAAIKPYVSIVGGFNVGGGITPVHNVGSSAVLTGSRGIGTSIDMAVAPHIAGDTPRKSIHVALSRPNGGSGMDWVSYNGSASRPNQGVLDPRAVYKTLFMDTPVPAAPGTAPTGPDPILDTRRSVLDAVIKDATPFCAGLSAADKTRCDQHFTFLREIEKRLAGGGTAAVAGACKGAPSPTAITNSMVASTAHLTKLNRAMADLLAAALACDITRVWTLMETSTAAHHALPEVGVNETFHELFHRVGPSAIIRKGITYKMGLLADLLQVFRDTPFGPGNLLDRSAILSTTCVADGQNHGTSNYPIIVSGKAGGKLKGNVFVKGGGQPVTRVTLAVARAAGAPLPSFGTDTLKVQDGVPEL